MMTAHNIAELEVLEIDGTSLKLFEARSDA